MTRVVHVRTPAVAILVVSLVAACAQAVPAPGGAASPPPGSPSAPVTTGPATAPPSAPALSGSWTATLTGPKPGAGTYSGTGDIYCAATSSGGSLQWTATGILLSNEIADIGLMENPSGFDTISVQTPGGIETGLWFVSGNQADASANVVGSGGPDGALVSGDGSWTDMAGNGFTMHVSVECSDVSL